MSELAEDLDFISNIVLFPDLVVVGLDMMLILSKTEKASQQKRSLACWTFLRYNIQTGRLLCFGIDIHWNRVYRSSWQAGHLYATWGKLRTTHDFFFKQVLAIGPELARASNAYFITDNETAFVAAVQQNLPAVPVYRCWNHVKQNAK